VTRQTVIAIELGRYSPSLEIAFKIARVFERSVDDVFGHPRTDLAGMSVTAGFGT
jgi:putative transcriptional regulator